MAIRHAGPRGRKRWRARVTYRGQRASRLCVCVLALGLWLAAPAPAIAEPSAECRDLAARFASAPGELDLQALAGLMTCLSAEMKDRTGGLIVVSPPRPPAPLLPPRAGEPEEWAPSQWPASSWGPSWPPVGPDIR
jgi:hypothetical protein